MPDTPDIAAIAVLIGDRTRATALTALLGGRALTASELARAAGVTKQTISAHLSRLVAARLVAVQAQGRNRYFRLADSEVGQVIENLMGLAERVGAVQVHTGPVEPALRKARVCYDHLAGELGVLVFAGLVRRKFLRADPGELVLTEAGRAFFRKLGIDLDALPSGRRPLCLACLDWSVRRHHLAGSLGAGFLSRCLTLRWARRAKESRVVHFSALGETALRERFAM